MSTLTRLTPSSPECVTYRVVRSPPLDGVTEIIVSTPETRAICNDPLVRGIDYTRRLTRAAARALVALRIGGLFEATEQATSVLTILRGGLNFGLREALADAFKWNNHGAWYLSAQRRQIDPLGQRWEIVEDSYTKMTLGGNMDVVCGDVVATGTSLKHALMKLSSGMTSSDRYRSLTFFTIGGRVAGEHVAEWRRDIELRQRSPVRIVVVYFEGIFGVAGAGTPLTIKLDGTDLLRCHGTLAPEFVASQYDNPLYPLERCTIYDAGSRACHVPEYLADVAEYWHQVVALADSGRTFHDLVTERCPEVDPHRFGAVQLGAVARSHLAALTSCAR